MEYKQQVSKEHYSFEKYFTCARWMSYWYQTKEIANRTEANSVLDIGPGTTFLKNSLAIHRSDLEYQSVDIAKDLEPDIVGSVTDLPLPDNSFDIVCAFEVLEHIEFSDFESALQEMKRVSKKYIFLSLPHFGPSVEFLIKVPFIKKIKFAFKISYHPEHEFRGEHYWEIGKKGYPIKRIKDILQNHFTILDDYVPFEHQYHHFFILSKK